MIHNNSPSDAAEIKGLIKFHAPRSELIMARPRRDLFPVDLTGLGWQVHTGCFTDCQLLPKRRIQVPGDLASQA